MPDVTEITIELPAEAALKLLKAFTAGKLPKAIKGIRLADDKPKKKRRPKK